MPQSLLRCAWVASAVRTAVASQNVDNWKVITRYIQQPPERSHQLRNCAMAPAASCLHPAAARTACDGPSIGARREHSELNARHFLQDIRKRALVVLLSPAEGRSADGPSQRLRTRCIVIHVLIMSQSTVCGLEYPASLHRALCGHARVRSTRSANHTFSPAFQLSPS